MKKIFSLFVMALVSASMFAATIGAPASIDFGTYSIKGLDEVTDSVELTLSTSGISDNGIGVEVVDDSEGIFWTSDTWLWANGTPDYNGEKKAKVYFYAIEAGTYTATLRLTDYDAITEDVPLKVVVTGDAIVAKTMPFERIESTSGLKSGDTIVFVCESAGAVGGPLEGTYLPAITENVSIDATHGTAQVPETAQLFVLSQYSGNWQLTAVGTTNRLLLDISGKGAFAYGTPSSTLLAGWGISISGGVAEMYRPSDETFPVWFNGDRFKPYKNTGSYSEFQLYKKAGAAVEIQSSLTIEPATIAFAKEVEMGEMDSVTISYTAENLTEDIVWSIEGADAAHFSVTKTGNRESGTVKIVYKGTKTTIGAVSAQLSYLTQDVKLDAMEGSFPISLTLKENTVKLTKIEFVGVPDSLVKGKSIDLKPYMVLTPNDAVDKSLTWTVDKSYQGTVEDCVYTAKNVTGEVTITATSVAVPSVSGSVTLMQYEPKPASITLDKHEITVRVGEVATLQGIVGPEGAPQDCYFTIRNTDILKYGKGDVTGSAKLTAKALCAEGTWVVVNPKNYQDIKDSCLVKVVPTAVDSVAFEPAEIEMTLGNKKQLSVTILPEQAAADQKATYVSSDETIVSVTTDGLAEAKAEGTAVITATADGKSAELTITVVAPVLFEKVTDATILGVKDTIILAGKGTIGENAYEVVAGAHSGKILTPLTSNITVLDDAAGADEALRLVLGTLNNKDGFTLQPVGSSQVLAENGNDFEKVNTTSTKNMTWQFVADAQGVYVQNVGNTNAYIKYLPANNAIKPYKATTANADLIYVYVRKFVAPTATGVTLNKDSIAMHVGDQDVTLKATVAPSDAVQTVLWSSSDENVATIVNGKVHAVAKGTAVITAKVASDESLTATCKVTVSEWEVESIELDVDSATLLVGETLTISATVLPTGHKWYVDFYTSDESVATVTLGGVVTAVGPGDVVIRAVADEMEAKAYIHVDTVPVPKEMGETTIAHFLEVKDTFNIYTLTGVVSDIKLDNDGLPNVYGNFDLTDSTGTIYIYGLLTAEGVAKKFWDLDVEERDTLTLKGAYKNYKGKDEIENAVFVAVKKYVEPVVTLDSIWLDVTEDSLLIGETLQLTAITTPEGYEFEVVWSSSDETIATVSADGLVTGVAMGDVVITATSGEKEAKATIHVYSAEGIEDVMAGEKARKVLREGRLVIIRNGATYTVEGISVER